MISLISALGIGALLGLRHATDADHVVAVTTIVAREPSVVRAARIGALWGLGHSLTVLVLGGAIIAFRLVVPPRVGLGLEFAVAVMLVVLGFANLRRSSDAHSHDDEAVRGGWRPVLIGVVHGLAGSAAVAILVLTTIADTAQAIGYLVVFGLGTVAGMILTTMLVALPATAAGARGPQWSHRVRLAAGFLSVVFGVLLAHELIVEQGLFSASPTWDPH